MHHENDRPKNAHPWPASDDDLIRDGRCRYGLRLIDEEKFIAEQRNRQAEGRPYPGPPTEQEREETDMWDEVYRTCAARGMLTGTALDPQVLYELGQKGPGRTLADNGRRARRSELVWRSGLIVLAMISAYAGVHLIVSGFTK